MRGWRRPNLGGYQANDTGLRPGGPPPGPGSVITLNPGDHIEPLRRYPDVAAVLVEAARLEDTIAHLTSEQHEALPRTVKLASARLYRALGGR